MPDSFFTSSKSRKRKRSETGQDSGQARGAKKPSWKKPPHSGRAKTFGAAPSGSKVNGIRSSKKVSRKKADEELDSDHTNEENGGGVEDMELRVSTDDGDATSGEEDIDETPAQKRLRLATLYLQSVKEGLADGEFDAAEIDKELISTRLKQDVMEHSGKVHLFIADSFNFSKPPDALMRARGHRLSVTSAVASNDAKYLFTAGKEGSIIKWNLSNGKKLSIFHKRRPKKSEEGSKSSKGKGKQKVFPGDVDGHTDEVLALALSEDGKYLVSGGKDRNIGVWDVEKGVWVKGFSGHRDTISALAFRKGTQQLYSASFDRTVKIFDLSVMGYVETLFGHQDPVLSLDALRGETAVSVGGMDKTVRYWKVAEESQLVFRGGGRSVIRELLDGGALEGLEEEGDGQDQVMEDDGLKKSQDRKNNSRSFIEGRIECVAMIDETTFVSGGDSGSICLWTTQKKKPIFKQAIAHGFNDVQSETEGLIQTPRWITAITSLRYSDLFASGSWDGDIRIWKLDPKLKSFSLMGTVPAPGVVNSLQFISPPKGFVQKSTWAAPKSRDSAGEATTDSIGRPVPANRAPLIAVNPIALVAGIGQEHRLGRWIKMKGNGATNCALVVAFSPRTAIN